jgi:hypothetical protein
MIKNLPVLLLSCCLAACAITEPRLLSHDEQLEQTAQKNERFARMADDSNSPQAARVYRERAAESRAEKKVQPPLGDQLLGAAFDVFFDVLFNALIGDTKK